MIRLQFLSSAGLAASPFAGVLLVLGLLSPASAADVQGVASFLQKRCFDCRADGANEGELNLKALGTTSTMRTVRQMPQR